jgi:AraC-like DNA-binding protein
MYWVFEGNEAGQPYVYRSMADASAELVFHYRGLFDEPEGASGQVYSMLHAPASRYRRYVTAERFGIFGAYLYPFALTRLLGSSLRQVVEETPDLSSVWGCDGRLLEEAIITAPTHEARAERLSGFLRARLSAARDRDTTVVQSLRELFVKGPQPTVRDWAGELRLSERQLERKCREYTGFAPTRLARVLRFQQALKAYGSRFRSLTDLAHGCGYYDQAHFIREFRSFSGYTPKEYFRGGAEGADWRSE